MINEPGFLLAGISAVLIFGVSKGGFGGGLGIVAVPLLSLVMSPVQAAAVLLPVLCIMDLYGLWLYRGQWDRPNLRVLVLGAALGIAVGAVTFRYFDGDSLRLLIGCIALWFTLDYWLRRGGRQAKPREYSALRGGLSGAVGGFTSFVAHAGAPPVSMYLLPLRLPRTLFVGTTVALFAVVNYLKLIPYAWLGQFPVDNLKASLLLMPFGLLGIWLGAWLHHRISDEQFYRVCYGFLLLVAIRLVWDGLT
ncbi:MAG: sulfite exporter TauE/SafE family protein [Xanthomonadales bacterium]|nr:sulfite exporter TauE/SafE family protein [Xanthomonadales bacterium]